MSRAPAPWNQPETVRNPRGSGWVHAIRYTEGSSLRLYENWFPTKEAGDQAVETWRNQHIAPNPDRNGQMNLFLSRAATADVLDPIAKDELVKAAPSSEQQLLPM